MKITFIRDKQGSKITSERLDRMACYIERSMEAIGFETKAIVKNSSRIDLTLGGSCFRIIPEKLGYNASYTPFSGSQYKLGYKRTRVPTWDQRVEFNNMLNKILDNYEVSANIKAMELIIRQGTKSYNENDWFEQESEWRAENRAKGYFVDKIY